jgi:chromosome segregation ATPase
MISVAAAAWIAGSALLSGGGVWTFLTEKNKKEMALKQEEIDKLQSLISDSQEREKKLLLKIEKLEQDKKHLAERISELQIYLEKVKEEQFSFESKLQSNDTRFKRIIAFLTFRLKALNQENSLLKTKLESVGLEIEEHLSQIKMLQVESEDYENKIISSLDELKVAELAIQELKDELSQAS